MKVRARLRSVATAIRRAAASVTPFGWTVIVGSVSAWVVGAQLGWDEFFILAATGMLLVMVAAASTIGRLELASRLALEPARVVVGERAAGSMTMTNLSSRHSRAVRVELPVGAAAAVFDVPRLASKAEHDELFVVPTSRRAVIAVGPVTTVRGDVLGIVRRTRTWSDRYEIFVHPRTVALETIASGLVRDLEGQTTNHLTNSDIAFHTLRDYVPGDDRRHVHWKTSAKLDQLMVRQYVDTRRSHVCAMLSTDRREYSSEAEFEIAVSVTASVTLQALRDAQTVTVILGGQQVAAINARALLDTFSRLEWHDGGGMQECCATARRVAHEASVTVLAVGRVPSVLEMRSAAARASAETRVVVVQCNEDGGQSYRSIARTAFVELRSLAELRRALVAVL